MKLKPNSIGLRGVSGSANKEVGSVSGWKTYQKEPSVRGNEPGGTVTNNLCIGPSRPSDPTRIRATKEALEGLVPKSTARNGNRSQVERAKERNDWSTDVTKQEVDMDSGGVALTDTQ